MAVAGGGMFSVALTAAGTPLVWGRHHGADPSTGKHMLHPSPLILADGKVLTNVSAIAAAYEHTLALTREGTVLTWRDTEPHPVPVVLADGTPLTKVAAIAAGNYICVVVRSDP